MSYLCCRLAQEYIIAVVRNRSGIDAGEIDYNLNVKRFERMSIGCLNDAIKMLDVLRQRCIDRRCELEREAGNAD